MEKKRIWELDFLRGLFIVCVIVIHAIFDARNFLGIRIDTPPIYDFIQLNGGTLFVIISGICVTLGHHFIKRGLIVLSAGALVSAVTYGMYYFQIAGRSIIIYWGVLHLLGTCMLLYGILHKLPVWFLCILGILLTLSGYWIEQFTVDTWYLCFIGLLPMGFSSSDFFPLLPYLGWFIVGIVLGRLLYKDKASLLPKAPAKAFPIRAISFCGRHSLWIYLLHQPILYGIMMLLR